jgi:hypothetical protein
MVIHQPVDIFVNNVRTKHETFLPEAYDSKVGKLGPPRISFMNQLFAPVCWGDILQKPASA